MSHHGRGAPGRVRGRWPTAYLVTVAGLTGCGVLLGTMVTYVSIFATDSCGTGTGPSAVCTTAGLLTLWALPWLGLGVAAAASAVLGVVAWRRERAPWPWLGAGVVLYLGSLAGAWAVMVA
ncbi:MULTISPECIES: hypothetical protein [unclassified Streptomyces]|uniref:hypothetical protein n=1 Tax=unclassified Streptomyces TaxID=2593676 RepID=UPI0037F7FF85